MVSMDDKEVVFYALRMWKNHIQTGDVNMSSDDAIKMGKPHLCRMITQEQQDFVIRLEELSNDALSCRSLFG